MIWRAARMAREGGLVAKGDNFHMRNLPGWLETRLAQNVLNYIKHYMYVCICIYMYV